MDKVELTPDGIEKLLLWGIRNTNLVKEYPCPIEEFDFSTSYMWGHMARKNGKVTIEIVINSKFHRLTANICRLAMNPEMIETSTMSNIATGSIWTLYKTLMAYMAFEKRKTISINHTKTHEPSNNVRYHHATPITTTTQTSTPKGGHHRSPEGVFSVRGHYRHYKSGKIIWIAQYKKGEGKEKSRIYKM